MMRPNGEEKQVRPPRMYKYLRWTITANRDNINVTQMSEFEICDNSGTKMARPSGTTITGNITGPSGETVDKLIDGSTSTKYCPNGALPVIITITLGESIKFDDYHTYKWYTANDVYGRDPVSWIIEVSADGTNWTLVNRVVNATITTTRYALAYTGTMARPNPGGWKPGANTIAYYPLSSTSTVNDMSGNNLTLTNSGVTFNTYDGVNCAYFNGSSYLTKNGALFTGNPTFTVSFYTKCIGFQQSSGRAYWFVGTGDGVKSFGQWISSNNQGHKLQIGGWSNDRDTGYTIDNNWHHIVFKYSNGAGEAYVDGNSIYSGTWSPNIENSKTVIGGNPNLSDLFYGYISNFICENKARTADEVLDYYNKTKSLYGIS